MENLKKFGKIEFVNSRRAKRVSVKIKANGLRVSMPSHVSRAYVVDFLLSKEKEILSRQHKLAKSQSHLRIVPGEAIQTATFVIKSKLVDRENLYFKLINKELTIEIPAHADLEAVTLQTDCWKGISYFLKNEAKRVLPDRVMQLAEKHGFYVKSVKIQSSKTRWGSCSDKKNINLSLYLLLLPENLIDYVILHELCHTKEMNHSEKFWQLMDKVTDNSSKKLRNAIKEYKIPE